MKDKRFLASCGEGGRERDVGADTGDEMIL
jgi:hypothetical protein